jgi:hypothetical protein
MYRHNQAAHATFVSFFGVLLSLGILLSLFLHPHFENKLLDNAILLYFTLQQPVPMPQT